MSGMVWSENTHIVITKCYLTPHGTMLFVQRNLNWSTKGSGTTRFHPNIRLSVWKHGWCLSHGRKRTGYAPCFLIPRSLWPILRYCPCSPTAVQTCVWRKCPCATDNDTEIHAVCKCRKHFWSKFRDSPWPTLPGFKKLRRAHLVWTQDKEISSINRRLRQSRWSKFWNWRILSTMVPLLWYFRTVSSLKSKKARKYVYTQNRNWPERPEVSAAVRLHLKPSVFYCIKCNLGENRIKDHIPHLLQKSRKQLTGCLRLFCFSTVFPIIPWNLIGDYGKYCRIILLIFIFLIEKHQLL